MLRILLLTATVVFAQQQNNPHPGRGFGNAGFVPNPAFDTERPQLPADLKSGGVLIFSKTNGYRDEPAMQASTAALAAICHARGWPFFATENGAVMNADQLAKFKVVVWNNTSGNTLNEQQQAAFKTWVENGGSFVGVHGAGGDPVNNYGHSSATEWPWLIDTLIGAQFVVHSGVVPAEIHIEDPKSPLVKGLPALWKRSEEWYAFTASPRTKPGYHIIATVDEKSYAPGRATMGEDHPLVWWHCVGKGHAVYSALGHAGWMYSEPLFLQFLDNMMGWGIAENGRGCPVR
jgi:type 1 glutamine amidotransferase